MVQLRAAGTLKIEVEVTIVLLKNVISNWGKEGVAAYVN